MSGARLDVQDVRKAYAGRAVLAGVSLTVPPGGALVLLGASGTGKTTLLRIVAGLERPDGGHVRVDGVPRPRAGHAAPGVPRVGLVFQGLELWPNLSVAEHLAYGLPRGLVRRERHARVAALAELVGLPAALLARKPATLSGGEQQRVAIARTLGSDPPLLLFDEPLASLDPARRGALRLLVRSLGGAGGRTLLMVTHDAQEALALGDEIAVLDQGRVVDAGPPERLYQRPRTLASARALGPVNALAARRGPGGAETALGPLALDGPADRAAGAGLALLRPEQVALTPASPGGPAGRVEWVQPRGPDYLVGVRLGAELVWARAERRPAPGEATGLVALAPAVWIAAAPTAQGDAA